MRNSKLSGYRIARKHMCGVVMVETAIVLPVLLLLLFATAELGRLFYSYNTVNKIRPHHPAGASGK